MTNTTCQHCGGAIPKPANNIPRVYCSTRCAYGHRNVRRRQRAEVSRATHEHNMRVYDRWLAERNRRLDQLERQYG